MVQYRTPWPQEFHFILHRSDFMAHKQVTGKIQFLGQNTSCRFWGFRPIFLSLQHRKF